MKKVLQSSILGAALTAMFANAALQGSDLLFFFPIAVACLAVQVTFDDHQNCTFSKKGTLRDEIYSLENH